MLNNLPTGVQLSCCLRSSEGCPHPSLSTPNQDHVHPLQIMSPQLHLHPPDQKFSEMNAFHRINPTGSILSMFMAFKEALVGHCIESHFIKHKFNCTLPKRNLMLEVKSSNYILFFRRKEVTYITLMMYNFAGVSSGI